MQMLDKILNVKNMDKGLCSSLALWLLFSLAIFMNYEGGAHLLFHARFSSDNTILGNHLGRSWNKKQKKKQPYQRELIKPQPVATPDRSACGAAPGELFVHLSNDYPQLRRLPNIMNK